MNILTLACGHTVTCQPSTAGAASAEAVEFWLASRAQQHRCDLVSTSNLDGSVRTQARLDRNTTTQGE